MPYDRLIVASLKSGTIGALAMVPFGLAFRASGLRVGYYGPLFASLFLDSPGPAVLFAQHLVLGWISAFPLVLLLGAFVTRWPPVLLGAIYGALYYVVINSLVLPLYFGDPLPWGLGVATVIPSLVIHLVFGATVGYVAKRLLARAA
jgi:uncharacterized membrane protein YagU involved in acid resistance